MKSATVRALIDAPGAPTAPMANANKALDLIVTIPHKEAAPRLDLSLPNLAALGSAIQYRALNSLTSIIEFLRVCPKPLRLNVKA
jgi:hypothetical protein